MSHPGETPGQPPPLVPNRLERLLVYLHCLFCVFGVGRVGMSNQQICYMHTGICARRMQALEGERSLVL